MKDFAFLVGQLKVPDPLCLEGTVVHFAVDREVGKGVEVVL